MSAVDNRTQGHRRALIKARRAPSVACLARVRVDTHVCVSRAGCVAAGIWIGAATGR